MLTYGRVSETGLNANYFEDYTLIDDGGGRFLALDCPEHSRLLVVVGNHFLFARGRALDLPRGATLADLVGQADPADKRALLDCELSLGKGLAGADPWRIDLSTLPFREDRQLFAASVWRFDIDGGQAFETGDEGTRVWTIHSRTLGRRELSRLFPS